MVYQYKLDDTPAGTWRLARPKYEIVQEAFSQLRSILEAWNQQALEHGAAGAPYEREVSDLTQMIKWGDEKLSDKSVDEIVVVGISVGRLRYAKAALMFMIGNQKKTRLEKSREGWPDAALKSLDDEIDRVRKIADVAAKYEPHEVLWEIIPKERQSSASPNVSAADWDAFISHASEDKEEFVRPMAERLRSKGLSVWFDEFTLTVGDSLRRSIDQGLGRSRFGVVVISPSFLRKDWPQRELDGLFAREVTGRKIILPVWHNITLEEVRAYSPMLADRLAATSSKGLDRVIDDLTQAIMHGKSGRESPDAR